MNPSPSPPPALSRRARVCALLVALLLVSAPGVPPVAAEARIAATGSLSAPSARTWQWPVAGFVEITARYQQPTHDYGAGHRGIDMRAPEGSTVRAPAGGTIAWVGTVVDRPLLTIDHDNGLVSTLEPVTAMVTAGERVERGQIVGTVASGGHTAAGAVHWGVRRDGEYINPATLLGSVARPILLPCCDELSTHVDAES